MDWSGWYSEGPIWRRIRLQHGTGKRDKMKAVVDTVQPDRGLILEDNKRIRQSGQHDGDLSFGRHVGRIPLHDYQNVLPKTHPELFVQGEPKQTQAAWAAFINSPEGEKYRLRRA